MLNYIKISGNPKYTHEDPSTGELLNLEDSPVVKPKNIHIPKNQTEKSLNILKYNNSPRAIAAQKRIEEIIKSWRKK